VPGFAAPKSFCSSGPDFWRLRQNSEFWYPNGFAFTPNYQSAPARSRMTDHSRGGAIVDVHQAFLARGGVGLRAKALLVMMR